MNPNRKVEPQRSDFYVGIEKNILTNAKSTKGAWDLPLNLWENRQNF